LLHGEGADGEWHRIFITNEGLVGVVEKYPKIGARRGMGVSGSS
jgi:hypothetical protein